MKLKYIIKRILIIFLISIPALSSLYCGAADETSIPSPGNPVIAGLKKIELQLPIHTGTAVVANNDVFQYAAPANVVHMILFLCDDTSVPTGCSSRVVVNNQVNTADADLVAGNSTSFTMGTSTTAASGLFDFINGVFDTTGNFNSVGTVAYEWFIIGYDDFGNLIATSPAWQVNISW